LFVIVPVVLVPALVFAVVMPMTFITVFALISVTIYRRRRIDHWRRLIDNGGRHYIYRTGHAEKNVDVCVCRR